MQAPATAPGVAQPPAPPATRSAAAMQVKVSGLSICDVAQVENRWLIVRSGVSATTPSTPDRRYESHPSRPAAAQAKRTLQIKADWAVVSPVLIPSATKTGHSGALAPHTGGSSGFQRQPWPAARFSA